MKAIMVKLLAPTKKQPFRLKAHDCDGNWVVLSYEKCSDGRSNLCDRYRHAALALCEKMQWSDGDKLVGGWTGKEWVFCFPEKQTGCFKDALSSLLESARWLLFQYDRIGERHRMTVPEIRLLTRVRDMARNDDVMEKFLADTQSVRSDA